MKRSIATIGMFDGVHLGHRFLIEQLRHEGNIRNLETRVFSFLKHPLATIRPECVPPMLSTAQERTQEITSLGIDHCHLLDFTADLQQFTARQFMAMLHDKYRVDAIILGFNNRFGSDRLNDIADYKAIGLQIGVEVIQAKEYPDVSSSIIRQLILDGKITKASTALGRPYKLKGKVVKGKQLGRTIGFPTANLSIADNSKLIPPIGAYACVATIGEGKRYPAMVNIGYCPTVGLDNSTSTIEANIIGYDGNLYGDDITLEFFEYLRGEQRFDSLDKLVEQLNRDRQSTLDITTSEL